MQGTVLMLMALSGLGCHNKSCDVAYAPPTYSCFGGGCYANVYPTDYASPGTYSSCYSGCYSGCYSSCFSGCFGGYGGGHGCGLLARLFGGCGWRKHSYSYGGCYGGGCYGGGCYGGGMGYDLPYDPPIFGYALQYNYGTMGTNQYPSTPPGAMATPVPSEAAPPVPPNPAPTTPTTPGATMPAAPMPETPAPAVTPPPPAPADVPPPAPKPGA
jgi:hypothetical protein